MCIIATKSRVTTIAYLNLTGVGSKHITGVLEETH